jgi:hypothetical protein
MEHEDFPFRGQTKVVGDCWEWIVPEGYPYPYANTMDQPAHRYVYTECVGPIAARMSIDHMCHNTRCVRPAHLRQVTHKQNMENRKGAHKNNRTGVRNVMLTREGSYQVRVTHNHKTLCFGTYADLDEAARVAKEARQKLFTHSE